jgi:hypothetical protein|tara:strand:- start:1509 stop:2006 length:498 start_codon:yes stop_codon:yes gene_type:complete
MTENLDFIHIKNFLNKKDRLNIKKDLEKAIQENIYCFKRKSSGKETINKLHLYYNTKHWKNYYNKLLNITKKYKKNKILYSWCLRILEKEKQFFHRHKKNTLTSIYYVTNDNYELGTHIKNNSMEIIVPGYENSILIFKGELLHDAVFPKYKLKKPRFTLITDYE